MIRLIIAFIFLTAFSSCKQIFFILTSFESTPNTVVYPPKSEPSAIYPSKKDITILMYDENNIYAYVGTDITKGKKYKNTFISKFLKKEKALAGDQLKIYIKEDKKIQYNSIVAMLNQMTINNIKKYSLTELNDNEKNFINQIR